MMLLLLALQASPAAVAPPAAEAVLTLSEVGLHKGRWPFIGYYPERAQRTGVSAQTAAVCRVAAGGVLADCVLEGFEPKGYGFDEATLKLLADARTDAATRSGQPTEDRQLRVALTFKVRRGGSTQVLAR